MMMMKTWCFLAFAACGLALPANHTQDDFFRLPSLPSFDSYHVVPDNGTGTWPYRTYRSTNLTSPVLNITKTSPDLAPGFVFLTVSSVASSAEHQQGPYILTSAGDLIWSAGGDVQASNLRTQMLHGETVLTYWQSTSSSGGGYGEVVVLDSGLREVARVCPEIDVRVKEGAQTECVADTHESYITSTGTMLVTVYNITTTNLSSVGGPATGWVYDSLAVEVDIASNEVVWMWSALEHVPVTASKLSLGTHGQNSSDPWSWFHMNSIQSFKGGVCINSRETWGSYYVSHDNGSILWSIDGETGGDFGALPAWGSFSWQHHARLHPWSANEVLLTYFADDNDLPTTHNTSTALGLLLTVPPSPSNPPRLHSALRDPTDPIAAFAEGSHQLIPSPNGTAAFVGYGTSPTIKEFSSGGEVVYSADFGYRDLAHLAESYRAFKGEWRATPRAPIDFVVKPANGTSGGYTGFVSWNGATDVEVFVVFGGRGGEMRALGRVARRGFETGFEVPAGWDEVRVGALERGRVVGASEVVCL